LIAAFAWRRPWLFPLTLLGVFSADAIAFAIKAVVRRDRPAVRYAEPHALVRVPHDHSFPSGHAATGFAAATILATGSSRRVAIPLYALAAAIAFSRVYVGVHYPLDVLAGALLGIGIGWIIVSVPSRLRRAAGGARPEGTVSRNTGS